MIILVCHSKNEMHQTVFRGRAGRETGGKGIKDEDDRYTLQCLKGLTPPSLAILLHFATA